MATWLAIFSATRFRRPDSNGAILLAFFHPCTYLYRPLLQTFTICNGQTLANPLYDVVVHVPSGFVPGF
eukprot:2275115-Rhodomonas_salina.2